MTIIQLSSDSSECLTEIISKIRHQRSTESAELNILYTAHSFIISRCFTCLSQSLSSADRKSIGLSFAHTNAGRNN